MDTFGIDTPVTELSDVPVQQITDALDAHEQKVDSGRISLDEAFEIAIAIEGSEADAIYMYLLSIMRKAIEQSDQPYLIDRIVQVEKDMVSHVDGLVKATQRFAKDSDLIRKRIVCRRNTAKAFDWDYECCALHRRFPACAQATCSSCTVVWLMPKCVCNSVLICSRIRSGGKVVSSLTTTCALSAQ